MKKHVKSCNSLIEHIKAYEKHMKTNKHQSKHYKDMQTGEKARTTRDQYIIVGKPGRYP